MRVRTSSIWEIVRLLPELVAEFIRASSSVASQTPSSFGGQRTLLLAFYYWVLIVRAIVETRNMEPDVERIARGKREKFIKRSESYLNT